MINRRVIRVVSVILTVTMYFFLMPQTPAYAKTTKEQLEEAEEQHKETTSKLKETEENINNLNGIKSNLQGELNKLNQELTEVSNNLADLEAKIADKEEEIAQAERDLEEAIATEEAQYEAMKKRVQFMYERRNTLLLDVVFASSSFAEAVNKNDYIEQLEEYDRKQLDDYKATRAAVEDAKAKLEEEKAELDEYYEEVRAEQEKVTGYVNKTSQSIGNYSNQIADAEAVADAYAAQAAKEEENISALKKKLAEEIAMSKLAAQSSWRDISEVEFAEGDRYLLASLIYCEAGNQPYAGQLAVGAVVINRVLSSVYPNTVVGVIYQNRQFSPASDGHLAVALANGSATAACYKAADEAMSGQTNVGTCVYFRTPVEGLSGIQIGAHVFY